MQISYNDFTKRDCNKIHFIAELLLLLSCDRLAKSC